jgi:hypothetical protein
MGGLNTLLKGGFFMDNVERDFQYDQKMDDIKVQMELLVLEAFSSVLDRLMDICRDDKIFNIQEDVDWPF